MVKPPQKIIAIARERRACGSAAGPSESFYAIALDSVHACASDAATGHVCHDKLRSRVGLNILPGEQTRMAHKLRAIKRLTPFALGRLVEHGSDYSRENSHGSWDERSSIWRERASRQAPTGAGAADVIRRSSP